MDNISPDRLMEEDEFSIGYWIKRRRKALDLTQKDLAQRVGCALITIAKIEADQRKPSREVAGLLAAHLEIPLEQRESFVQILRGLKSARHLRKIAVAGLLSPAPSMDRSPISASEATKLRGMQLIGKISRSKLVGRGAELALAGKLWELANAGESQALVLHGEPGIGKSRLAQELITHLNKRDVRILVGECFAEGGMPYAPIVHILQNETALPKELPTTVLADIRTIAPQLEVSLSTIPPNSTLDPHAEQMRLFESLFIYFRHVYQKKPLLLLIEDVHWADYGSLTVLRSLMHRFRQARAPVLMLLTTRDISPNASTMLNNFFDDLLRGHLSTTIHLERFDQNATQELLTTIFAQDITGEFTEFIHRETQGNPFFIAEVCKDLVESGQIYWDKGRWERKQLTDLRVPQNVRAAVQARLDKLGSQTQELLQMAAIVGRRFEFDILRHVLQEEEEQVIKMLETAKTAQIIQETGLAANGGEFEFSHVLITSVLREGTSVPRRRNIHKRIVEALERFHPDNFSLLAYHCGEAAENESAAGYFRKAGDQAMRAFAHEDAIHFYSQALTFAAKDSTEACQLFLARAKVYDLRGERSPQLADLQQAEAKAEAAQDTTTRAAVALARAEYAIQVTEQSEVIEYARRAIALAEEGSLSEIIAQAHMLWGRALLESGELQQSREHLKAAGRIAREAGFGLIEARSAINLGNVDYRRGDYMSAREKYIGSLETLRKLGERRIECMVINNLGNIYWTQGDLDAALRSYRESLEIARRIGDRLNEARGLSNIGSIFTEQHQYSEALQILEPALPIFRDLGQQADEAVLLGHLGDVMEALGRYEEAYEYKRKACELSREIDDPQSEAEFLTGLSRIETFRENVEPAKALAYQAIAISQEQGYPVEEAAAWQALGFSNIAAQDFAQAEESYAKSLDLYQSLHQNSKCAELHAELAWLAHERGDQKRTQEHLDSIIPDRSLAALKNIQQPSICWCCYQILKGPEPDVALTLLQKGYSVLDEVAGNIADPKARAHYLGQLPHHAALIEAWERKNASL